MEPTSPPYPEEMGGVVLSATIDKYAYGSLRLRHDKNITVKSLDYDIVAKYHVDDDFVYDGELDLVKAVLETCAAITTRVWISSCTATPHLVPALARRPPLSWP